MDTDGISTVEMVRPNEDQAYLLVSELNHLNNLDIKDFNYYVFEEDLDKMSPGEFEWWFKNAFEPWLENIEDNYIDIEYNEIKNLFKKPEEKKLFLKKIIHFVMFFMPYQLIRNLIKQDDNISGADMLLQYLNEDNANLIKFRSQIIVSLEQSMNQTDDFVEALTNFEKVSKKNLLDTSVGLLDEHIKKQNFFLNIFKEIILNSDMEKILQLVEKYVESDVENI